MELADQTDQDILAIVDPIMDNLMEASTAIDDERHTPDFTQRAKCVLPKESFQSICSEYQRAKGLFGKREFVAVFRRPGSVAVVWRQWFTNASGEFVAELVLVERGGHYLVDHVMVF